MRYVFIVQGEGRGHLTQAISMERLLRENGHEVAAVLVGKSPARRLPAFFERTIQAPVEMFESFNFEPQGKFLEDRLVQCLAHRRICAVHPVHIPSAEGFETGCGGQFL